MWRIAGLRGDTSDTGDSRHAERSGSHAGRKIELMEETRSAAEEVFRRESGRIIATLIRISGSFDLAEEAMQEAFTAALAAWPDRGIPDNPGAWITATAHRKLIDITRRERTK